MVEILGILIIVITTVLIINVIIIKKIYEFSIEIKSKQYMNFEYMQDIMRAVIDVEKKVDEILIKMQEKKQADEKDIKVSEDDSEITFSMPKNVINEWFNGIEGKNGDK